MSQPESKAGTNGFAVLCDADGTIVRVISDGVGVTEGLTPRQAFATLVHPDCKGKAIEFLRALRVQKAAFNWELTVKGEKGHLALMHFAGGVAEDGFLIVGATSRSGVASTFEELARINNEQTTLLRQTMKDLSLQTRAQDDRDSGYYDELTRLNNELVTTQRELAKKNIELARVNDLKNQFLGIAAHDLRNPLDIILNYSRFLLDEASPKLDKEHIEFLNAIRSSSEFMLNLVNDLLDVSKIEAGRLDLELETADLGAVIKYNVALNRTLAEKKSINLTLVQDAETPGMRIDVSKIEQVLNNLIGNAIKFSPPHSRVEVRVTKKDADIIISVRDEGEGIKQAEIDRLFQPFERGRVKPTGGEKSTGLGLVIVKKIVAGHGGKIWVDSEVNNGATFFVSLPIR